MAVPISNRGSRRHVYCVGSDTASSSGLFGVEGIVQSNRMACHGRYIKLKYISVANFDNHVLL
jgi:hypothetical protein